MNQWFQRGTTIAEDLRIRTMISSGNEWQLYSSNTNQMILVASSKIYSEWNLEYDFLDNVFRKSEEYYILCSSGEYLISSFSSGPYPTCEAQVAAFSQAFGNYRKHHDKMLFTDGIYVEEYSAILPDLATATPDNEVGVLFGKWISGGVGISIENFERIAEFISWMPANRLYKYALDAGFVFEDVHVESRQESSNSTRSTDTEFSLIGRPDLEKFLKENIIDIVTHRDEYQRMGINFPGATILYGPPGCGKTYAIERLLDYLNWPRYYIDASTIASPYIHDTSRKIGEVFNEAISNAPSVIVIDEMEAFLSDRESVSGSSEHHTEEIAEFLRRIPEAISSDVLIVAMTNLIDRIDPAILRRGRFDYVIEVKMPNSEEIETLLKTKFKDLPISSDVDIHQLSAKLDGHPMSDVTFVVREAGRVAVKNKKESIDGSCFEEAFKLMEPKEASKIQIGFRG